MSKLTLAVFAFVLIFAYTLADDDWPCNSDYDCERGDCCLAYPGSNVKVCRDKPDDYGQPCGGPYACSSCGDRLQCVPSPNARGGYTGTCGGGSRPFFGDFFDDDD